MMNLICQNCGKQFTFSRNRAYCDDCQKSTDTEARICLRCGKIFYVEKYDKYHYKKQLYCSDSCAKQQTKTLICQRCGKKFTVGKYPGTDSFIKRKYCSDICAQAVPDKYSVCENCGKTFKLTKTDKGNFIPNKYCSRECRLQKQREKLAFKQENTKQKTINTCQSKYGVNYPCLLPQCIDANPCAKSKLNADFAKRLQDASIKFIQEYGIKDYIYDFYLPDLDIFVEINPTFTHACVDTTLYPAKDKNYHKIKTKAILPRRCINIWDWDSFKMIVKLLQPKQKLYARNLELRLIEDKQEVNQFLNHYHLQGKCKNNVINLGLYNNEQLVQVMTFGKPRYNKNYEWELLRLCTHSDFIVIGGSCKLFKYFIKNYKPKSIISYCDLSKFTGNVYEQLGFTLLREASPSKHWSKGTSHITNNLLRQRGYDQLFNTSYGKGTSNEQLMLKNGWLPIYDCGQATYVYNTNLKGEI